MSANWDKQISRYERFAQLRAAYPDESAERIIDLIHEEEIEAAEREAGWQEALAEHDAAVRSFAGY